MEISTQNPRKTVGRACLLTALIAGIGYALLSVLLYPLYIQMESNVAYADSILLDILYLLTDGEMLNVAICILCYPLTAYAIWRAGVKKSLPVMAIFALIDLLRFGANFFMTALVDGALPDAQEFLSFDLPYMLANYLLEMLLYICVILCPLALRAIRNSQVASNAAVEGLPTPHPMEGLLPLQGIFNLKNPLQLSAFLAGIVFFVFRFSAHFINQLYEAVAVSEVALGLFFLSVGVDLILDLLVGLLLYFSFLCFASYLYKKES